MNSEEKLNELNFILNEIGSYGNIDNVPSEKIDKLTAIHLSRIPHKLYKYFPCETSRIDSVLNKKIWASRANTFEPDDALLELDKKKLIKYIFDEKELFLLDLARKKGGFSNEVIIFYIQNCLDEEYHLIPEKEELLLSYCDKSELRCLINVMRYFRPNYCLVSQYHAHLNQIMYGGRNKTNIICLTESCHNNAMWDQYADSYSGFCVEYSFDRENIDDYLKRILVMINGVIYNEKIKFDPILLFPRLKDKYWMTRNESLGLNAQFYYKKEKFSYENEWRIVFKPNAKDRELNVKGELYDFPFASRIYIGWKMENKYKQKLMKVAEVLQVPAILIEYDENVKKHFYI